MKTLTIKKANEIMNKNGGYLYLSGTNIQSLPDNLTVGGSLYLSGTNIQRKKVNTLKEGDYAEGRYLFADGILTHVKKKKQIGEYFLYIGKIKGKNVVSNGTHYAHCANLREGIADIIFKTSTDRGAQQYKNLTLDSEIKTNEAIAMYRIITGACKQGTQNFIDGIGKLKESYTIKEIIEMTSGHYGSEAFRKFFE